MPIFGLLAFSVGLGHLINGCDDGALERHEVEVLSKDSDEGDYSFDVEDFRSGESGSVTVDVGRDLWERTEPGQRVVLVVGPGRLGWPWLAGVEAPP